MGCRALQVPMVQGFEYVGLEIWRRERLVSCSSFGALVLSHGLGIDGKSLGVRGGICGCRYK